MKRKSNAGRHTKLSRPLIAKICRYIVACNTLKTAAQKCGVGQSTFYRWLEQAEEGDPLALEFREKVQEAKAQAEVNLVATIKKASVKDWKAAQFILSVRNEEWAKKECVKAEISGPDGEPLPSTAAPIIFVFPAKDGAEQPAT